MNGPALACAAAALALAAARPAAAGAWPSRPGAGKAAIGYSYLAAGSALDGSGRKHPFDVTEHAVSTYGEIGLPGRLAAGWSWSPYKRVDADAFARGAPTDAELSLTRHLGSARGRQFAVQALALVPAGPANPGAAPDHLYGLHGHGAWGFEARPLFGWAGRGYWMQAGAGLRVRGNGLAPQWRYAAAGGGPLGGHFGWLASLSGVGPLGAAGSGRPGDREGYFGWQAGLDFKAAPRLRLGAQVDELLGPARELPLGARYNAYLGWSWGRP